MNETIAVTGTGSAAGRPDIAMVNIGVEVLARSVAEARAAAAADIGAVLESLRGSGLTDRELTTASYSINPEYDHRDGRRLRGYRVSNMIEAQVRDLDDLGAIIDAAAQAGSDNTIVNGLRFVHEDDADLAATARAAAWEDARAKAIQLADLAGVGLGPVVSMSEQGRGGMPPMRAMAREEAMATSIEAGELGVSVTVYVEFGIGPKWTSG